MKSALLLPIALALTAPAAATGVEILPLSEVHAGMIGRGVTVFSGTTLDEFEVEVLGVLENTSPRRNTIMARLAGGPLAQSGVIAGMSGSPVYVDGRLMGAVSSGFLFSKEPIAGITPIEEMLAIPNKDWTSGDGMVVDRTTPLQLRERLKAIELGEMPSPLANLPRPGRSVGPKRALLPLLFSGFAPQVFEQVASQLAGYDLVPMQGAGIARKDPPADLATLLPGAAIAVELIRGDLNIAAYGTVTSRRGDEILAFGHPLFQLGKVDFPIATAEVLTVLPSVYSSFKLANLGRTVGALTQDRLTGVMGKIGQEAPMMPMRLGLQRGDNPVEAFAVELVYHRLLTPVLVELTLQNSLLEAEKLAGESTLALRGHIEIAGQKNILLDHFFSGDQSATSMSSLVAAIIQVLLDNPFSTADIKGVTLFVDYLEATRVAQLDRVWTRTRHVHPGEEVEVKAYLVQLRGEEKELTFKLKIPEGTPPGEIEMFVGDSVSLAQVEARSERYVPKNLPQLIDLINDLRKSSTLYAILTRPEPGVAVSGYKHTRLPLSAYTLLVTGSEEETLLPIRRSTLTELELPSPTMISGFKLIKLEVMGGRR